MSEHVIDECREVLKEFDSRGLLATANHAGHAENNLNDDALLASLGVEPSQPDDVRSVT